MSVQCAHHTLISRLHENDTMPTSDLMTSLVQQVREPDEILGSLEYTVEGAISNQSTFLAKGED